jgi:hypothetical protein
MTTYFVDADSGNDANDGLAWGTAKEHIQAAIDLIVAPLTTETVIKLKSNTSAAYEEDVTIKGIFALGADGALIIEPEVWTSSNYEDVNGSPFNATPGAGAWDIKGLDKPCELKLNFHVEHSFVEFRGLRFKGQLMTLGNGFAKVVYSQFDDEEAMAFANAMGGIELENCYLFDLPYGAVATSRASLTLTGDNYIENPFLHGIWAQIDSMVTVQPWGEDPDYYTTEIKLTSPRSKDFSAVRLTSKSYMYIKDGDINPYDVSVAAVKIINDLEKLSEKFYGVLLESGATLQGAGQMSFVTKDTKGDYVEMPAAQQVLVETDDNPSVID